MVNRMSEVDTDRMKMTDSDWERASMERVNMFEQFWSVFYRFWSGLLLAFANG